MNKIVFISSLALFSCSAFSYSLKHHHSSPQLKSNLEPENFSGTWAGRCGDEDVIIKIVQDDEKVTFSWGSDQTAETYYLNVLKTKQETNKGYSFASISIANINGSFLQAKEDFVEVDINGGTGYFEHSMNAAFLKDGDTLQVIDFFGRNEPCFLKLST